jgi:hypothetical protein
MRDEILDLSQVTDVRRTLAARPPRIVRGTLVVLVALLGTGAVWSATTKTDLVVKAPCRVRPIT